MYCRLLRGPLDFDSDSTSTNDYSENSSVTTESVVEGWDGDEGHLVVGECVEAASTGQVMEFDQSE